VRLESTGVRARVLVVDDVQTNRDLLARGLQRKGWETLTASDGGTALEILRSTDGVHVVLLDHEMPGMNGSEVAQAMRADPLLTSIPIIGLTGNALEQDQARFRQAGALRVLIKPVEIDRVHAFLLGLLRCSVVTAS
jgi:CheY-like chemotaxis protein